MPNGYDNTLYDTGLYDAGAVTASDFAFYQSMNTASSGGVISAIPIPRQALCLLFSDVAASSLVDGGVEFKKIFLKNENTTELILTPKIWVHLQPSNGERIDLAVGGASDANPYGVTYVASDQANPLTFPSLAPGEALAVWIRKTTPINTPGFERGAFILAIQGS